jgi:hypothetical protein
VINFKTKTIMKTMRKITSICAGVALMAGLTFTSCKKSYSCECNTSYTDGNGDQITLTKIEPLSEKMKDNQASSACNATAAQMKVVNDDLNADPTGVYEDLKTTCTVK